ncbi:L-fuculokinase [Vibrio mimicus]|uniref:L-fuculokinase n=1 Tax=Vibrio mimicus TaxID=674 RepID=UPI0002BAF093|nr:L-fuculokinase [Vibrio mimicus]EMB49201.1 L-fuculokinase [Vibrio mimicus CAIM 602]MBY7673670.1 L-fuculokinase [Vibrio mimicus]MBY7725517.1 L-fuculokinase [Vibrio mimicus]TXY31395.1 L-fuculokinase [Vibrio mimicus]SUQ22699.1 L-fuculokinase [Vibrio mimicus]
MSVVMVLDCGATNLRAIAIDSKGAIVSSHFLKNSSKCDEQNRDFHVWYFEEIWQKLVECGQHVIRQIGAGNVKALTVTTFGVDGAPFDKDGRQLYPIISWKCPRTVPVMAQVEEELDRLELFRDNGIGNYSFNTLYKLRWLKEHEPNVYSKMDKFVFISSMITHRLTGVLTTDYTMAGTSMLTSLDTGRWHERVLNYLALSDEHFPPIVMAGEQVGRLTKEVAQLFGLPTSTPVISAGHDTQLALVGSGAEENQAILSSGTWEILMARSQRPTLNQQALENGVTVELDSVRGLYNPAVQWLSSAVVEWVAKQFFTVEQTADELYTVMIKEAEEVRQGAEGVVFTPCFTVGTNGVGQGSIEGLSIHTSRGQIVRALFEGLSHQLCQHFNYLNQLCQLNDGPIVVVGGGTKNALWNQLRANALQRPLHIVEQAEATVTGAAMFAFFGAGYYSSIQDAQRNMKPPLRVVNPNLVNCRYDEKETSHA